MKSRHTKRNSGGGCHAIPGLPREQDALKKAARALGAGKLQQALSILEGFLSVPACIMRAEALCGLEVFGPARNECMGVLDREALARGAYDCLGHIAVGEGRTEAAIKAFKASAAIEPNARVARINLLGEDIGPEAAEGPASACIVTSIPPRDVERHHASTRNWADAGFEVISLNTKQEIDHLRGALPHVAFERAARTARENFDKDFIFLDDVLDVLARSKCRVAGIVNADILLHGAKDMRSQLPRQTDQGLVFGSRVDIDVAKAQMRSYDVGFDYFFMNPALAGELPRQTPYCLGLPWWDYYLPTAAAREKVPLFLNHTPVAYHPTHALNWSPRVFHAMGLAFVGEMTRLSSASLSSATSFMEMVSQERFLVGVATYVLRNLRAQAKPFAVKTRGLERLASPLDLERHGLANECALLDGLEDVIKGLGL